MTIYIVLPTLHGEALIKIAREKNIKILTELFPEGGFLAAFKGTPQQLGEELGMSEGGGSKGHGIIQPMNGYYGYGNQAIWTWVKEEGAK